MSKVKEFLIKVLDEGESTCVKDMKWPLLKIGKWLFVSIAFLSPLLACMLGVTFMDVNSKEFMMLCIPLLLNTEIFLCWLLYHFWNTQQITRKQKERLIVFVIIYIIFAFIFLYLPCHPEAVQAIASFIDKMHDIRDCIHSNL